MHVLLKHFPPRGGEPGLQALNKYGKTPLNMAHTHAEQAGRVEEGDEEDVDDMPLAMVRHDNTHVLQDPPWGGEREGGGAAAPGEDRPTRGRGLLEGAKKGEWGEVVRILEEDKRVHGLLSPMPLTTPAPTPTGL